MADEKKWQAHGICMNKNCGYVGDMWWYDWDGDVAICPECTEEIPYDEMALNAEERDALWKDQTGR